LLVVVRGLAVEVAPGVDGEDLVPLGNGGVAGIDVVPGFIRESCGSQVG
jgi:hypothetical protein